MVQAFQAYILIFLSLLVGGGALLVFGLFLLAGSLDIVTLGFGSGTVLWFDAGLSFLFFIQHSLLIRRSSRRFLFRFSGEETFGAIYSIASGIVLLLMVILWQTSASSLFVAEGVFRWCLRLIFVAACVGMVWSVKTLRGFDVFGIGRLMIRLRNRQPLPGKLIIAGPYLYVRHPLYFFSMCMIWSCPNVTTDRLLFDLLWTLWIIYGAILEEKDLVAEFGEVYQRYRKTVPMLFPKRLFIKAGVKGS
jgi:methanethiol S-methyltransferase